jgi:hypothetical protein
MARIIISDFIYSSLEIPPSLDFADQFTFQPFGATTAARIQLFQTNAACL